MNKVFGFILTAECGSLYVYKRKKIDGQPEFVILHTPKAFKDAFAHWNIEYRATTNKRDAQGNYREQVKSFNCVKEWIVWDKKKIFTNITFDPSCDDPNVFNYYIRPGITKEEASQFVRTTSGQQKIGLIRQHILEHIRVIWCNGDDTLYRYVMDWMASVVQKPHIKLQRALILHSKVQGAGKGFIIEALGKVVGYFKKTVKGSDLWGDKASLAKNTILLFLDELTYKYQDKDDVASSLKDLITSDTLRIRELYKDVILMKSFLNIIACSNSDYIVPIDPGDRRFCHILVSSVKAKDREYFNQLTKLLDENVDAFAEVLYQWNISADFNGGRDCPVTQYAVDQIIQNLDSVGQFMKHCLDQGYIVSKDEIRDTSSNLVQYRDRFNNKSAEDKEWCSCISVLQVHESYTKFQVRNALNQGKFKTSLNRIFGRHINEVQLNVKTYDSGVEVSRKLRYYVLPSFHETKQIFYNYIYGRDNDVNLINAHAVTNQGGLQQFQ
jgi:hypothetical protein